LRGVTGSARQPYSAGPRVDLAIGPAILTAFLAIGTPVLTSILTILAPILAPLHPGGLGLGVCRYSYRGWYSHANCGPYS
jgi:hypothetical protein